MTDRKGYLSDTEIKRRCAEEFTPKGKKTYALFSNPMIPGMMLQRPKDPASLMETISKVSGTTYEQQVENYIKGLRQIPNQSQEVLILRPRSDRAANTVRASRPMVQPVGTQTAMTSPRDSAVLPLTFTSLRDSPVSPRFSSLSFTSAMTSLRDSPVSPTFSPLTFTSTPPTGIPAPIPRQATEPQAIIPETPETPIIPETPIPETPTQRPRRPRMSSEQRAIREALESPTTAARVLTTPADVRVLRSRTVKKTSGASSSQETPQETPQERLRRMVSSQETSSQEIIEFPGAPAKDMAKDLL